MKFIRILDLSLQLLVLSAGLLLALVRDFFSGLLVYSAGIALVQSAAHLYYYSLTRNLRRFTPGRRVFHRVFRLIVLLGLLCLGLLCAGCWQADLWYVMLYILAVLGTIGVPASLYYIGLSMYELRMYLYLQAQSEAVDFGA